MTGVVNVRVTQDGPYRVEAAVPLRDASGADVSRDGPAFLCRCGQSRSKPFCDGSHKRVGFDGTEAASRDRIEARRDTYAGDGIAIYDDRRRCSHAGACTDGLPEVFKLRVEPWIDARAAPADAVAATVDRCPSGALAHAPEPGAEPREEPMEPSVGALRDGPYRLRGAVQVIAADGEPYERRNRQALCRCGQSKNKPFCDGTHWDAGFEDPARA